MTARAQPAAMARAIALLVLLSNPLAGAWSLVRRGGLGRCTFQGLALDQRRGRASVAVAASSAVGDVVAAGAGRALRNRPPRNDTEAARPLRKGLGAVAAAVGRIGRRGGQGRSVGADGGCGTMGSGGGKGRPGGAVAAAAAAAPSVAASKEWARLARHARSVTPTLHLRDLLADGGRGAALKASANGITLDYSRQQVCVLVGRRGVGWVGAVWCPRVRWCCSARAAKSWRAASVAIPAHHPSSTTQPPTVAAAFR